MAARAPRSVEPRDLGRRLARRLLPASIILGALVSAGFPATYYLVQKPGLERMAEAHARNLAARLRDSSPALWAQHSYNDPEIAQSLLATGDIMTIRVRDLSGDPISGFAYTATRTDSWWNRDPPLGVAPVRFNDRVVGFLEVGIARDSLARSTIIVFGLATAAGVMLAAFIYWFPVSVGRAMEEEIRVLVGRTEEINAELTRLLARAVRQHDEAVQLEQVARDITSSLDRVQVLHLVVERARTLCRADLAWLAAYDTESETARILALVGGGQGVGGSRGASRRRRGRLDFATRAPAMPQRS